MPTGRRNGAQYSTESAAALRNHARQLRTRNCESSKTECRAAMLSESPHNVCCQCSLHSCAACALRSWQDAPSPFCASAQRSRLGGVWACPSRNFNDSQASPVSQRLSRDVVSYKYLVHLPRLDETSHTHLLRGEVATPRDSRAGTGA
jgi:hypothetical protein